jgi:sugar/nucleoside kinase (ribokinase family)
MQTGIRDGYTSRWCGSGNGSKESKLKLTSNSKKVIGFGSALMDILVHESEDVLRGLGYQKGGMTYVEIPEIERIRSQAFTEPTIVPGGSACNTAVGIAQLGGPARFIGKRGDDEMGRLFLRALEDRGVDPHLMTSSLPTGQVLSLITPDAERTMLTHLGASADIKPGEVTADMFADSAIVHLEGYLLFNPELLRATLAAARSAGARISLDLASFTVVEQSKSILDDIIENHVDILIANEDEALAYTGFKDEAPALAGLAAAVDMAVLKVGARGSYVRHGEHVYRIPPLGSGTAVDTTGAGDLWAAGFLFGLVNGYDIEQCGRLASACGFEVCQVVGANIPAQGWMRIKELLEA